jgi:hypothetical protein
MDPFGPNPLLRSFKRHLYAKNRSARTLTTYSSPYGRPIPLRSRGTSLDAATRADLEAFMGEQLGHGVLGPGRVQGWPRHVLEQREGLPDRFTPLGSPDW